MIEYKVTVHGNGTKYWHLNGKLHREDGPAIEWADGDKDWYLNGNHLTEEEFNARNEPIKCNKVVTIDGVDYELVEVAS